MSEPMFTCKECGETKPLEGFYTNSRVDKTKPYQLVCRRCYQDIRKARESGKKNFDKCNYNPNITKTTTVKRAVSSPATLKCTVSDFHNFIGPKVRNDIQTLTKREKLRRKSICEECKEHAELEAAHTKGNDRVHIINSVLKKYVIDEKEQIIQVDLGIVIPEIIEAHKPISEHFKFLCSVCHRKYDNGKKDNP